MSLQYSQIISQIEKECGFEKGAIQNNATRLADFTEDINLADSDGYAIAIGACATWQVDDSSHTDYDIISTDLVSGQRDYTWTTDGSGNLILDVYKVMIKTPDGTLVDITPVDRNIASPNVTSFETSATGTPTQYDKLGNGIFLDVIPNYSIDDGLQLFVNRESVPFTVSDTTKKSGLDGRCHEYLVLKPAYKYARSHSLNNVARLENDVMKMEEKIRQTYASRERDVMKKMIPAYQNNR